MSNERNPYDLSAPLSKAEIKLAIIRAVVERQAEDEGLWFEAQTAPEAYLQQALRFLHTVVEDVSTESTRR